MKKVDEFLLKRFQKIVDSLQEQFGIHLFLLNALLIALWAFLRMVHITINGNALDLLVLPIFVSLISFYNVKSFYLWRNNNFFLNPILISLFPVRIISLFICCFYGIHLFRLGYLFLFDDYQDKVKLVADFCNNSSRCLTTVIFYLMSCTPKPPKQSKIKKKYLELKEKISNIGSHILLKPNPS